MLPGRLGEMPAGSFVRLAQLLDAHKPGKAPINMAVGDPRGDVPAFVTETITRHAHQFGEYPPIQGTEEWRKAAAEWLCTRFSLPNDAVDPERHVLPLSGTREGLFLATFIVTPNEKAGARPVILIPNPFYQTYAAAALAPGAQALYVPTSATKGFMPDFSALPEAVLARTAAVFLSSPSNPEGACADEQYWHALFALADRWDFAVFADECYADIYFGERPAAALTARYRMRGDLARLLTFHSLSKRSGLPGLRSGMVAGDPELIAKYRNLRAVVAPQMPMPIMAASAAAWGDEKHVDANRQTYVERFQLAQQVLGNRKGFRMPDGGFFLWLEVGNGEEAALTLWREHGMRVLPGAYMGRETEPGKTQSNPGFPYIRVALVHPLSTIEAALGRIGEFLS